MSSDPDPRETDIRETDSRDLAEPVPHRSSVRQRRSPVQSKFDKQHGYIVVKGMYSSTIRNLKFYGGFQYLQ